LKDVAYIALGSNLGEREVFLADARAAIRLLDRTRIIAESDVEETAPLGPITQGPFLNQMIAVETDLAPMELLHELQRIERDAGRVRRERWGPRTLDLDVVMFEHQSVNEPELIVPHPQIANREFWLRELAQLRGRPRE
jgi:2-amino-4-hydroxy-6-hydroxymethyldihydropteridine diphosphokinase